jgi:hypothetical protein
VLPHADAARRIARRVAADTGTTVAVYDEEGRLIGLVSPPPRTDGETPPSA